MINHINPLYTVALICAVACVLVLALGVFMALRTLRQERGYIDQEDFDEWMDEERWKQ